MNTHDAHYIGIFIYDIGFAKIHLILLEFLYITYEVKKALEAGIFKRGCSCKQHLDIGTPSDTSRHSCNIVKIPGRIYYKFKKFMNRHIYSPAP